MKTGTKEPPRRLRRRSYNLNIRVLGDHPLERRADDEISDSGDIYRNKKKEEEKEGKKKEERKDISKMKKAHLRNFFSGRHRPLRLRKSSRKREIITRRFSKILSNYLLST